MYYAIDKENFDFVNPNIKNNSQNYHLFNKISLIFPLDIQKLIEK